jgi:FkbM family methyltransferase
MKFITELINGRKLLKELRKGEAYLSYSQQAEDITIQRYFGEEKKTGLYVDIGAFDPVKYSNTFLFYKKGWRGINIEPNPDQYEKFKKQRPNDININVGINDKNEQLKYYKFNAPALNTFEKKNADEWASRPGFKIEGTINIETYPLSEVLGKYLKDNQEIDFFSIDVEGMDFKVVKSNDWNRFRPKLVLTEESIVEKNIFTESDIYNFFKSIGYDLWCITGGTIIYIDILAKNK